MLSRGRRRESSRAKLASNTVLSPRSCMNCTCICRAIGDTGRLQSVSDSDHNRRVMAPPPSTPRQVQTDASGPRATSCIILASLNTAIISNASTDSVRLSVIFPILSPLSSSPLINAGRSWLGLGCFVAG